MERELKAWAWLPLSIFVEFDWCSLSGGLQRIIFSQLCNTLDPLTALAFSSASSELWALTQALQQQLKADYEVAAALGWKLGKGSCKALRKAKMVSCVRRGLSSDDLALLGTLGSVMPALETLALCEDGRPDGCSGGWLGGGRAASRDLLGVGDRMVDGVLVGGLNDLLVCM